MATQTANEKILPSLRDRLVRQALQEITFAREHKKERILQHWHVTEKLYYGKKKSVEPGRSNVMLPKMAGFINALLSKIDTPPIIRYKPSDNADTKGAKRLTALFEQDAKPTSMNFDMKDIIGKKQALMYGRAIYEYHASSDTGYKANLEPVDVYDFLIDPSAGGMDLELARYLGRGGIIKDKYELTTGVEEGRYDKAAVKKLLKSEKEEQGGDAVEESPGQAGGDEPAKENRYVSLAVDAKVLMLPGMFRFREWYTTADGKRYYMLINEEYEVALTIDPIVKRFESGLYPYWSWAPDPDLTEFWTPASADLVKEIFMAQDVIINQGLDNNEDINKPMRGFDIDAIYDPVMLKRRPDGLVPFKAGTDMSRAVHTFETKPISNTVLLYNALESIQEKEGGATAEAKGTSNQDKVGIYEGNLANLADRFGLLNKSYANAYHRFALLYFHGVCEHLNVKTAIKMIGEDGVEIEEITKRDIIGKGKKRREFEISVSASDAERSADAADRKDKLTFISNNRQNQLLNQGMLTHLEAELVGWDQDQIAQMFDPTPYAGSDIMGECSRDIQQILDGQNPPANRAANLQYLRKIVRYLQDKGENMGVDTQKRMMAYIDKLIPIVAKNTGKSAVEFLARQGRLGEVGGGSPETPEAPETTPTTPTTPTKSPTPAPLPTA
jgi:hypothetical protein